MMNMASLRNLYPTPVLHIFFAHPRVFPFLLPIGHELSGIKFPLILSVTGNVATKRNVLPV